MKREREREREHITIRGPKYKQFLFFNADKYLFRIITISTTKMLKLPLINQYMLYIKAEISCEKAQRFYQMAHCFHSGFHLI